MGRDTEDIGYSLRDSRQKLALAAWSFFVVAICIRALLWPRVHSVYPVFAAAARNWRETADLYLPAPGLDRYRYSPLAALLVVPFTFLPDRFGGIFWRLLIVGAYLAGLAWWSRIGLPHTLNARQRALLYLLVLPLSVGNINNGQSNPLVLGLLLAATAAVVRERWNLAAACVALASLFKVYPIVFGLLLVILYPRRFAGRLAAALAVGLALPFLFRWPPYVMAQYISWAQLLLSEPRYGKMELLYSDLRQLCRAWFAPLSFGIYIALQLVSAAGVAALCLAARRARWPRPHLLTLSLALACCWMTVFGLSAESSTYILLAPVLGWALLEAWLNERSPATRAILLCSYALFCAQQIAGWFPGMAQRVGALGLQPLAGLLLFACLLFKGIRLLWQPGYFEPTLPSM